MGGFGYVLADTVLFRDGELLFEAGAGPQSTPYLKRVARAARARLVSVDIDSDGDAVEFLDWWPPNGLIRFAYLDSWDWPYANMPIGELGAQRAQYAARGAAFTEDASAVHHLALVQRVAKRVAPGAMIVIDDTWPEDVPGLPGWNGKGRDAVPWLLACGWGYVGGHVDIDGAGGSGRNAYYVAVQAPGDDGFGEQADT